MCDNVDRGCPEQRDDSSVLCDAPFQERQSVTEVVWVMPLEDATIFVDYDGDGVPDNNNGDGDDAQALQSLRLFDEIDYDLSGALVWALDTSGQPVKMA